MSNVVARKSNERGNIGIRASQRSQYQFRKDESTTAHTYTLTENNCNKGFIVSGHDIDVKRKHKDNSNIIFQNLKAIPGKDAVSSTPNRRKSSSYLDARARRLSSSSLHASRTTSCIDTALVRTSSKVSMDEVRARVSVGSSTALIQYRSQHCAITHRPSPVLNRWEDFSKTDPNNSTISTSPTLALKTQFMKDLHWALNDLGWGREAANTKKNIDDQKLQIEKWVNFIDFHVASTHDYKFDFLSKIFSITESASSLQLIACLFRNVVTYSKYPTPDICSSAKIENEKGYITLTTQQMEIMSDVLSYSLDNRNHIQLSSEVPREVDQIVMGIFGYSPGETIELSSYNGFDILLSTLIAARLLENVLSLSQVAQLAVILKLTVPMDYQQENILMYISNALDICNIKFDLSMNYESRIEAIQLGVDLRNRIDGYKASNDVCVPINHIWKIFLPKFYPTTSYAGLHSINEYCIALQRVTQHVAKEMESPNEFVWSFHDYPSIDECNIWNDRYIKNKEIVSLYLKARLLSVYIVSCVASLTGPVANVPYTFFFGDIAAGRNPNPRRLGDDIVVDYTKSFHGCNKTVYDLLLSNQEVNTNLEYDVQRAPLAAYVFQQLGNEGISEVLQQVPSSLSFLHDKDSAKKFLKLIPLQVLKTIGSEMSKISMSRALSIDRLMCSVEKEMNENIRFFF